MRSKLRHRCAKPSESQRSKSLFRLKNAPKKPTQNTVAKRITGQEKVECGYRFDNFLQRPAFRPLGKFFAIRRRSQIVQTPFWNKISGLSNAGCAQVNILVP